MLENKFFPYIESFITIFQYTTTKNIFTKTSLHSKKLSKSTKKNISSQENMITFRLVWKLPPPPQKKEN